MKYGVLKIQIFILVTNKNNINEYDSLKNVYTLNLNKIDIKKIYVKYTQSYKKLFSYKDNKLIISLNE